ncbi:MAG: SH3 domain-containing protein, partial [Peptostreptococcaceae bacterium]
MKNQRLRALIGAGLLTASMAFVNIAEAATKYAKTTDNLNFRTGPSTSDKVISTIKKNTQVEVISYEGKWAKIKYNNKVGYSSKDYLKEVNSSSNSNSGTGTSTSKKTGTVTTDTLNVRSGAGTNYNKIGTVKKGAKVTILSTSKGWHKIEMSGGKTGWVSADYIKITSTGSSNSGSSNNNGSNSGSDSSTSKKTGTVTADALNVRSGAGTSYSKVGSLKKGAKVAILSTSKGWYKIEMSGSKTGWVSADYIKITSTGSSNSGSSNNNGSNSGSDSSTSKKTGT